MSEIPFGNSDDAKVLTHVKAVPFRIIPTLLKLTVDNKGFFDTSDSENGPMVPSLIGGLIKKHTLVKFSGPGILKSNKLPKLSAQCNSLQSYLQDRDNNFHFQAEGKL